MANNTTQLITVPSNILLPSILFKFIAMIIGVLGNTTVIIHTAFTSKEKTTTSYLVTNLALADLLVCLTFYPIWIIEFIQTMLNIDSEQDLFCKLSRSTIWSLLFASVAILLAITVDRFLYIVKPLKYLLIVTRRNVFLTLSGIWVTSCCFLTVSYVLWRKCSSKLRSVCYVNLFDHYFTLTNVFIGCLPLIIIFVLNLQIFNVARKQRKRILTETAELVNISNEQSSKRLIGILRFLVGLKAAKTFSIVFMVFAFCVVTPTLIGLSINFTCSEPERQTWLVVFQYELYGINSIVNAYIYGMRHIKYRKAYGNILSNIFRCNKRRELFNPPRQV